MDTTEKTTIETACTCGSLPDYSAEIAGQKAVAAMNEAAQKLAKIPEDVIKNLQEAIQKLLKAVNGWEDTSDPEFDPNSLVKEIEKLLEPVTNTLVDIINSLQLPPIPGLDEITELLDALKSMKPSENQKPGKLPEIPQDLMQLFQDLLSALMSLCATLPMVLINIIFNAIDLILRATIPVVGLNLYKIIGMVPYIEQIPQLVQVVPDIVDVVTNAPGKIGTAVKAKLKQQLKAVNDMQIPDPPKDIQVQIPDTCPVHG